MCDYHVPQNQGRRKHRTMTFVSSHLDFAAVNTCWQDGAQLRLTTRGGSWSCGYSAGRARACHSVALSPLIFSAIVWWCAYIVHCIANCDVYWSATAWQAVQWTQSAACIIVLINKPYILKVNKSADSAFQSKKNCGKVCKWRQQYFAIKVPKSKV